LSSDRTIAENAADIWNVPTARRWAGDDDRQGRRPSLLWAAAFFSWRITAI